MRKLEPLPLLTTLLGFGLCCGATSAVNSAPTTVTRHHNRPAEANPEFTFENLIGPLKNDAASTATFSIVNGTIDRNSGGIKCLNDGRIPSDQDAPGENFFFQAGSEGGRLLLDLGRTVSVQAIRSYSWHPGTRAPQAYTLWAAEGTDPGFEPRAARGTDPVEKGWTLMGKVEAPIDRDGEVGGQYGVELSPGTAVKARYLLLDVKPTRAGDPFAHTFFSEIDVIDSKAPDSPQAAESSRNYEIHKTADGKHEFALDVSQTPDLAEWARTQVIPMAQEWYPRLAEMLAGEGFKPARRVTIVFDPDMQGVAETSGNRVRCAAGWFRENLKGEALGAVFHELVHVVQEYGRRNPSRVPGWLVEGIADYVRWFKFEPDSRGAEITSANLRRARYDGNYRISANFLNWVSLTYCTDLVPRVNEAIRGGQYRNALWKEITGKELEVLGTEWRAAMEKKVGLDSRVD